MKTAPGKKKKVLHLIYFHKYYFRSKWESLDYKLLPSVKNVYVIFNG